MKYIYTLALLLFVQVSVFSKHIIGGVLSYECLGGGTYRFTMKMYRDCDDPTGANFDNPAPFTIFKGDQELVTFDVNPNVIEDVAPPPTPCLILPANVCVQEGIYEFEYTFAEWPSTESYHVTYMRCCRNATVVNIENPDDVGATFTVEILPASQQACNNSPTFNAFPPIAICINEPLNYDHSAFDAEGDQLVYSFCSPLLGGAPPGGGGGGPCDVVAPDPACPPPYTEAVFINPPYTEATPMAGNPVVAIDPVTGMLSGTPIIGGQFVFAVCVREFRNGILMSEIRRDFQFNVTSCEEVVDAEIIAPNITLQNDEYLVETCNEVSISIENESSQTNVENFFWQFETPDSTYIYDTWNLDAIFPGSGSYEGILVLTPDDELCGDTANILVEIYPEVVAEFQYDYDTCVAGPVFFNDQSYIDGMGNITERIWDLGDGRVDSSSLNPIHLYTGPMEFPVTLYISDEHGCSDSITNSVAYFPIPRIIDVRPSDTLTCPQSEIIFNNLSTPLDFNYDVFWEFGDGATSSSISPSHQYSEKGRYDVRMTILSPIGCFSDTTFAGMVRVTDPPIAAFDYTPDELSNITPDVSFFNKSQNSVYWNWLINDQVVSQQADFQYTFRDTGLQTVTLIATHPFFCQDTLTKFIDVTPEVTFFMPNAFTPNEDTSNEFFRGNGVLLGITDYKMEIWDRWGTLIYETDSPEAGWNGRIQNDKARVPAGAYVYLVKFTGPRGKPHEYKGYATVFR